MSRRTAIVSLGLCLTVLSGVTPARALVEIERAVWTDAVDRSTRQYKHTYNSPIRGSKAYLWMQLKGSPELLMRLRNSPAGSLPIRHEWYRYESDQVTPESPDSRELSVDLTIGRKKDLQKLSYEVDASGAFRWRIWSGKEQLYPGWWRVDVVYESGEPVICPSADDANKSCEFLIEVR
jgi:hypothetical protein